MKIIKRRKKTIKMIIGVYNRTFEFVIVWKSNFPKIIDEVLFSLNVDFSEEN